MLIVSDCMMVPVRSDISVRTAPELKDHIEELMNGGCHRIILDMDKVGYIDSAGIALILSLSRKMRAMGGLLTLVNVSEMVNHILSVGCLAPFIPCLAKQSSKAAVPALPVGSKPSKRLTVRIEPDTLQDARERLREFLEVLPLSSSELYDIILAAGEAMGNCVLHTDSGIGYLTCALYPDRLVMEAVDSGPGFEIAPDVYPVVTLEHGRGIKIMRLLCDDVEIKKKPVGHGTIVRLVKMLQQGAEPLEKGMFEILSA